MSVEEVWSPEVGGADWLLSSCSPTSNAVDRCEHWWAGQTMREKGPTNRYF